ncbi:hypothetical protein Thiowin_01352 [Thiorhodovibrio winogradskyi]|uniref:Phytase-like domain-containing protein n=1 Tax=Thiorhodovibrio winogradskyi TaxID=77007 RepID=A0ABZ0S714_9GAMM|nr:hypothetical protein [Thiorhodovibrio winogradskyi]
MKKITILGLVGMISVFASAPMAGTPLGGLAVALSPDEDTLVTAGDNRTLYVLNAADMEIVNRVWLGTCIVKLDFDKDGKVLLAEASDGNLLSIDTTSWQVAGNRPKSEKMSVARAVNRVAVLNPDHNGHSISFLDISDLSEQGRVTLPKGQKVAALGLDAAGERLGILTESVNDESEPKEPKPADLRGLEGDEFRLKHDGKTTQFLVFKVPSGEPLWEQKTYYSPSMTGMKVLFDGEAGVAVNYSDLNAKITPEGEVSLFKLDNGFNYGTGFSHDQSILLTGGLAKGTYTKVGAVSMMTFSPDRLQGWPEYFKDFAISEDGTAYGATSGYRIVTVKPGGMFAKSTPIF